MSASETITFEPPGPGSWSLDLTHHGRRPVTPYMRTTYDEAFQGMSVMIERFGLPLAGFRTAYVHGCGYFRVMGIGEPDEPKGQPPRPLLWLVARLHPLMRKRNKTAAAAWRERRWRSDVDEWFGGAREQVAAENRRLQAVDPAELEDAELLAHAEALREHFLARAIRSFETHGGDLIPVGDYLAHCSRWGIDAVEASSLLAGASPASLQTAELLEPVAEALAGADATPSSVAEVRALDPEVDRAVSAWLDEHGWRLVFSDDLDSVTLAESPALQLRALLAATEPPAPSPDPAPVRAKVPAEHQEDFDHLLAEARYGLRLRDDNVGVNWNWTAGMLRRAVLEIGSRLGALGRLQAREHVLELEPEEAVSLLRTGEGPGPEEVAERAAFRDAVHAAGPPDTLGPPEEEPPPFDLLPAPLARAANAMVAIIEAMEATAGSAPLHGSGVGDRIHRGRARVVSDPAAVLADLEPDDVVVTELTGPAWNSLLPMIGALVVEEGGPMSHAAIVSREFGIPAIVGVRDATRQIPDGAQVEVDPTAGAVRVL